MEQFKETVMKWKATDGTIFDNKANCELYEEMLQDVGLCYYSMSKQKVLRIADVSVDVSPYEPLYYTVATIDLERDASIFDGRQRISNGTLHAVLMDGGYVSISEAGAIEKVKSRTVNRIKRWQEASE